MLRRPLRVADVSRRAVGSRVELSARIRGLPFPLHDYRLFYRFPEELGGFVQNVGDPFVAALLLPAMQSRRDLVVEAPVSRWTLDSAAEISARLAEWFPQFRVPRVIAAEREEHRPALAGIAAFFTGGVDSFHTVLSNLGSSRPEEERITNLLYIVGFDVPLRRRRRIDAVARHLGLAARDLGLPLSIVESNLRPLSDSFLGWANYYSSALASVAHAIGPGFRRVHMSSSMPNVAIVPWGSHAIVYPLWSGPTLGLTYDEDGLTRTDKLRTTVVHSPAALRHLRVCWQNPEDRMNCGRCEKCLRTKLALFAEGVLHRCATLDSDLDVQAIEATRHPSCVASCFPEILSSLEQAGAPAATTDAIKRLMARSSGDGDDVATGRLLDRYGEHPLHGLLRRVRGWCAGQGV